MKTIQFPRSPNMTQGTIFIGGVAEDYAGCQTSGLTITARCDATNDKVNTYNYLPIVSLQDWLHVDGKNILIERLISDAYNGMKSAINIAQHSLSILDTENLEGILEKIFPEDNKKLAAARKNFKTCCDKLSKLSEIKQKNLVNMPYKDLVALDSKAAKGLLRELISHKVAGYYFLPDIDCDGDAAGYVVLLREVRFIPRKLAENLMKGLSDTEFEVLCSDNPHYRGRLSIQSGDMAMPMSVLISPHIEHLMQIFSNLFGRIGIPDTAPDFIDVLCKKQPSFHQIEEVEV